MAIYFSDALVKPDDVDSELRKRVNEYKAQIRQHTIALSYDSIYNLHELVSRHLEAIVKRLEQKNNQSIDEDRKVDEACYSVSHLEWAELPTQQQNIWFGKAVKYFKEINVLKYNHLALDSMAKGLWRRDGKRLTELTKEAADAQSRFNKVMQERQGLSPLELAAKAITAYNESGIDK